MEEHWICLRTGLVYLTILYKLRECKQDQNVEEKFKKL